MISLILLREQTLKIYNLEISFHEKMFLNYVIYTIWKLLFLHKKKSFWFIKEVTSKL